MTARLCGAIDASLHTMLFLVAAAVPEKEPPLTKVAKSRLFFSFEKDWVFKS